MDLTEGVGGRGGDFRGYVLYTILAMPHGVLVLFLPAALFVPEAFRRMYEHRKKVV